MAFDLTFHFFSPTALKEGEDGIFQVTLLVLRVQSQISVWQTDDTSAEIVFEVILAEKREFQECLSAT